MKREHTERNKIFENYISYHIKSYLEHINNSIIQRQIFQLKAM